MLNIIHLFYWSYFTWQRPFFTVPRLFLFHMLFTGFNTVEFASAITQSSWTLLLGYYTANTLLSCRISKPKINKFGAIVIKNQQFWLLWHLFPCLRLKPGCFENNSIITRELVPFFYVESADQIHYSLFITFVMWPPALRLKKSQVVVVFFFAHPACLSIFKKWSR